MACALLNLSTTTMRKPRLVSILGALLVCAGGTAAADSAYAPTKRVAPLPGGHFLCDVSFGFDRTTVTGAGSVELDHAADAMKTDEDALICLVAEKVEAAVRSSNAMMRHLAAMRKTHPADFWTSYAQLLATALAPVRARAVRNAKRYSRS